MSRLSFFSVAAVCVALFLLASTVHAQEETNLIQHQPQSQGFLERIMTDYVYPVRDYDWRGMVRRFLSGVVDYLAPDSKQPKVGGPYGPTDNQDTDTKPVTEDIVDLARSFGYLMSDWFFQGIESNQLALQLRNIIQGHSDFSRNLDGESGRFFNFNSNIPANTAAHSWAYLSVLVMYCMVSILGAVLPIYTYAGLPAKEDLAAESMMMPEMPVQDVGGQNDNFQNGDVPSGPANRFQTPLQAGGNFQRNPNFQGNGEFSPISNDLLANSHFRVNGIPE